MRDARDELTRRLGVAPKRWAWGRLTTAAQPGRRGPRPVVFGQLLEPDPFDLGGGSAAVDASSWDAARGYAVTSPPSMRMVVDLDDLDRSRWVSLTGASGHVWSGHYDDQTPLWLDGRTLTWATTRQAVEKAAEQRLVLTPAS